MSVKPFSPHDVECLAKNAAAIPEEVIMVINGLLVEGGRASKRIVIKQDVVLQRLENLFALNNKHFDRSEVFERHWLDFEAMYCAQGWLVSYDKPGYCESYDAHWVFTKVPIPRWMGTSRRSSPCTR